MRVALGLVVSAIVVLSGCVSAGGVGKESAGTAPGDAAPVEPQDIDPNSPYGVLQGTVVNEENLPVTGAQVGLQNTTFTTLTDSKGFFVLKDLPPGKYVLLVGALGYRASARNVEIAAATITPVALALSAIEATQEVYYQILHFTGSFDCALETPLWISMCSWPYTAIVIGSRDGFCTFYVRVCAPPTGVDPQKYGAPGDIQNNKFRFNFTVSQSVGEIQAELTWTPSSAAATKMNLLLDCGDYDPFADECIGAIRYGNPNGVSGLNPIKHVVKRDDYKVGSTTFRGLYQAATKNTKWDLNKFPEVWLMNYIGLPFGKNPGSSTATTWQPSDGYQVALSQRYDVWDTLFYNGEGPEDWTVLKDG